MNRILVFILSSLFILSCGKKDEPVIKPPENKDTTKQIVQENNPPDLSISTDSLTGVVKTIDTKWEFKKLGEGDYGEPKTQVYLIVNGKKNEIAKIEFGFSEYLRESYKDAKIPSDALTACRGWWAGAGIDYWVIRKDKELIVMGREIGETTDEKGEPGDYIDEPKKIKTIKFE